MLCAPNNNNTVLNINDLVNSGKLVKLYSPLVRWVSCYLVFLGTKPKKDNQIGNIKSWGPTFRVSVDLVINSYHHSSWPYQNIISFKGNDNHNCCNNGDRVPAIWYHPTHKLHIVTSINGDLHGFNYHGIKLGKRFNLVIEHGEVNII